jgi:hypothetical protein
MNRSVNAMLNEAYRVKFAPAQARGDAVAVSVVWLVASTTVKGRPDVDLEALRGILRARTAPQPIGPLPVPADVSEPKPAPAPLAKPIAPESTLAALAVGA